MTAHFYSTFICAEGRRPAPQHNPRHCTPVGKKAGRHCGTSQARTLKGPGLPLNPTPHISRSFGLLHHLTTDLQSLDFRRIAGSLCIFYQAALPLSPSLTPQFRWPKSQPIAPSPKMQPHHHPLPTGQPADVPTPTPCIPAIPRKPATQPLSPGNKDKRANSKAGTAGVCCLEIRGYA